MSDAWLWVPVVLLVGVAAAHSYLGERFILIRLFRRTDLPRIGGSDWFTRRTVRFAWHVTSVAWLGFAALLATLATDAWGLREAVLGTVAVVFLIHAVVALVASRGRHLSWPVFGAIAIVAALAI